MISNVWVAVAPFNSVPMFGTEETGGSLSHGQKGPTETVGWRNIAIALIMPLPRGFSSYR
jgi:hypothetical protein